MAWYLCVWGTSRSCRELRAALLPELVSNISCASGDTAAWDSFRQQDLEGSEVREILEASPPCCWAFFPTEQTAQAAAHRSSLLQCVVEVWESAKSISEAVTAAVTSQTPHLKANKIPELSSWDLKVLPVQVACPGHRGGASQKRVAKFTKQCQQCGVGSTPTSGCSTVAVVPIQQESKTSVVYVGAVVAWGRDYKFRAAHASASPTALGPSEALITANLAGVHQGTVVLDPFCGGGSLLMAASHTGAGAVIGGDISSEYFQGGPGGHMTTHDAHDVLLANAHMPVWRWTTPFVMHPGASLTQLECVASLTQLGCGCRATSFDAIICDPPFGMRATIVTERTELLQTVGPSMDNVSEMLDRLFRVAKRILSSTGRLVCWMPDLTGNCTSDVTCNCYQCWLHVTARQADLHIRFLIPETRQSGQHRRIAVIERLKPQGTWADSSPTKAIGSALGLRPATQQPCGAFQPSFSITTVYPSNPKQTDVRRTISYTCSKAKASGASLDVWRAAWIGDAPAVTEYLHAGGEVDARDTRGQTPLQYAAGYGQKFICQLLLQNGADIEAHSGPGATMPIHRAAAWGHTQVIQDLLSAGASVSSRCAHGKTASHHAAEHGHLEALHALLNCGALEIDAGDGEGFTSLHLASRWGMADCVQMLLKSGAAPVLSGGPEGVTPAHLAAQWGHLKVLQVLSTQGRNREPCFGRAKNGDLPMDTALKWKRSACWSFLESLGSM